MFGVNELFPFQESLEDVGAELQTMSGELHKLMREIENKEHTIESLEKQLKTCRENADAKSVLSLSLSFHALLENDFSLISLVVLLNALKMFEKCLK